jgi:hypothetical protein
MDSRRRATLNACGVVIHITLIQIAIWLNYINTALTNLHLLSPIEKIKMDSLEFIKRRTEKSKQNYLVTIKSDFPNSMMRQNGSTT